MLHRKYYTNENYVVAPDYSENKSMHKFDPTIVIMLSWNWRSGNIDCCCVRNLKKN